MLLAKHISCSFQGGGYKPPRRRKKGKRRHKGQRRRHQCRRVPMEVDFAEVGWKDWIFAPPGYQAFACMGECR